jgi:hypothetical protein
VMGKLIWSRRYRVHITVASIETWRNEAGASLMHIATVSTVPTSVDGARSTPSSTISSACRTRTRAGTASTPTAATA